MRTLSLFWIAAVVSATLGGAVAAQEVDTTPQTSAGEIEIVDDDMREILSRHKVPAMAVGVIVEGRLHAKGVAGVRARGEDEPAGNEDKWHMGSCTKAMTATMIAVLVERGTLSWDTKVADVFPELAESMDPAWRGVTLDLLVRNRSGAARSVREDLWGEFLGMRDRPRESRHKLLVDVVTRPPEAEPGSKFIYSNQGFAIAGHMAETVTGTNWEDLMRSLLFEPLGMDGAGFGAPGSETSIDQPRGHSDGKPVSPGPSGDNPPAIGPAGTVHMTIDDWASFVAAHIRGEFEEMGPLAITPTTYRVLHTTTGAPDDSYSAGWLVSARPWAKGDAEGDAGRVMTHSGSNLMWYCVCWLAPERNFAVLVACNEGGEPAMKACDEAAGAMIRRYLER